MPVRRVYIKPFKIILHLSKHIGGQNIIMYYYKTSLIQRDVNSEWPSVYTRKPGKS